MHFNLMMVHEDGEESVPVLVWAPSRKCLEDAVERAQEGNGDLPECARDCSTSWKHIFKIELHEPRTQFSVREDILRKTAL